MSRRGDAAIRKVCDDLRATRAERDELKAEVARLREQVAEYHAADVAATLFHRVHDRMKRES